MDGVKGHAHIMEAVFCPPELIDLSCHLVLVDLLHRKMSPLSCSHCRRNRKDGGQALEASGNPRRMMLGILGVITRKGAK